MTGWEAKQATAAIEGLAPPGKDRLGAHAAPVDPAATMRRMLGASQPIARLGLRLAIVLVAWSPLWHRGRLSTLAGLPVQERAPILASLLVHPSFGLRELTLLLKVAGAMCLLADPTLRAASGYDRRPLEVVR
jgi:hypothetical protein